MESKSIGQRIAQLRNYNNMTQKDLAKLLHVSTSAIGMYEQGRREMPLDAIVKVSSIFSISTHWLLTGKPFIPKESSREFQSFLQLIE